MEQWKNVVGYEGYYMVSDMGHVKSIDRIITRSDGVRQLRKGRRKRLTQNQDGYLTVNLSKDGFDKRIPVHILVAQCFVAGWFDGAEVNHKDCDRKNNRADNLEWVSHFDNIQYALKKGRHVSQIMDYQGSNNPNFGNRKLSRKYSENKMLSIEKQSRPGKQNGRALAVEMLVNDDVLLFDTLSECANYLINNQLVRGKDRVCIASYISKAAKSGRPYYGLHFRIQ